MDAGLMRISTLVCGLALVSAAACTPVEMPSLASMSEHLSSRPAMRWDHRPEAAEWTTKTLAAVAKHDAVLASRVPGDIAKWCPAYPEARIADRRAFWVGMLSAVSKYESSWNPKASGGGGAYVGVMQISPATARNFGCGATSSKALKNGAANLSCAVEIMADQVGNDGVVAGNGRHGLGRDWMPFRKSAKRAEMAAWIKDQPYCQG